MGDLHNTVDAARRVALVAARGAARVAVKAWEDWIIEVTVSAPRQVHNTAKQRLVRTNEILTRDGLTKTPILSEMEEY